MAKKLLELKRVLENKARSNQVFNYTVPDLWNCFGYKGDEQIKTQWGEIIVNPYKFYSEVINDFILPNKTGKKDYSRPLSKIKKVTLKQIKETPGYTGGDWIKEASVYSTMIRTSAAWDHDRSGDLEDSNIYNLNDSGTFVKMLALLPLLKKMGINTVYMLPISKFSLKDKKGELGSPYGVSNVFELDPNLKDKMVGDDMTLDDEFTAFVEACHILDMRVMIDIIPRTNSVNSDLIVDHPDWFYWIKQDDLEDYFPPYVPDIGDTTPPEGHYFDQVYNSESVWNHIKKFVKNPRQTMPNEWSNVVTKWQEANGELNILDLVRDDLGLTIAPAFSDHINDIQPPWSDVTFFRMYLDHPLTAQERIGDNDLAPYILYDTIKSSWHPGNLPNQELWDTLSDIIPHFQREFGIDGARIDMGHALPSKLVTQIVKSARKIDPDFSFIAEQLDSSLAGVEKANGYNMIIGKGFYEEPRIWTGNANGFFYGSSTLECPVFAGGETHDTPRIAARPEGGKPLSKMLTVLNMFMPNGVPFINSGQEVYETQPMNTGLDCRPDEAYMLDPKDRYHGKLPLFDKYAFHYTNEDRWELPDTLEILSKIRNKYLSTLTNPSNFCGLGFSSPHDMAIGLGYIESNKYNLDEDNLILVIANTHVYEGRTVFVNIENIRSKSSNTSTNGKLIFSTHEWERDIHEFDNDGNLNLYMSAGEVKIIKL